MTYKLDGLPSDLLNSAVEGQRHLKMAASPSKEMEANLEALTTQSFTEANSKQGTQFEAAMLFETIASATPHYFAFITGASPVILKQRDISGGFVNARYDVFKNADVTGGTTVEAFNNNDLVVSAPGVTILQSPTVNVEGVAFGPTTYLLGSESLGTRLLSSFGGAAGEKVLAPNTTYLVRISNIDVAAIGLLSVRLWFYEGPLFSPS